MANQDSIFATIIIGVKHNKLSVVRSAIGTSGIINTLMCKFEFRTTDWAGIKKNAVFQSMSDYAKHNEGGKYIVPVNEQGECYVPSEVLIGQSEFLIGVFGMYDDDSRISSNMLAFKCDQGCYCIGTTPGGTTPSDYADIIELINKKQDKLTAGNGISIDENNVISCTLDSFENPLNITGATVGQIIQINAVDIDGNPTEWEAVDLISGSNLKSSSDENKISICSDGTMEVNSLTFDKIIQEEEDELIVSGGNA